MKKYALLSLFSLCVLVAAAPAMANHFENFTPTADCDGWCVSGQVVLSVDPSATLDYTVTLNDGTSDVATFSDTVNFSFGTNDLDICEPWGMDLCGDYTVHGEFTLTGISGGDYQSFDINLTCDCPPPPGGCTRTPGYWKNHPEAWPTTNLTVGCVNYTQAQILNVMWMPVRGDATIILFDHLVAAKLNVLNGSSTSINDAIDDADDFLCAHPLFSKPSGDLKTEAEGLKDTLADYNEGFDCDGASPSATFALPQSNATTPAQQSKSWGAMKASYK
jgi:hypothetical protein